MAQNEPEIWGTAIGSWGDVILDLAEFKNRIGHGGIILYTQDDALVDFVRRQSFVDDVRWVCPDTHWQYWYYYLQATGSWDSYEPDPIEEIISQSGIDRFKVYSTQLTPMRRGLIPWHHARLSNEAWRYAYECTNSLHGAKYYVIHPHSDNSCPINQHWPYWEGAIEYLLSNTPHTYILTGVKPQFELEHERLIDLRGDTKTMMDVFALAELSKGVFTTSNCLSHYAVVQDIPAVVCGNAPLSSQKSPFREFLQAENINLLYYEDGLAKFVRLADRIC